MNPAAVADQTTHVVIRSDLSDYTEAMAPSGDRATHEDTSASRVADLDSALSRFVEDMGLGFERSGGSRMAGRLLGWLSVCEPDQQSAEQLAAALPASTGSISTTSRQLISMGFVERVGLPGDRKAYYRLRDHAFAASLEAGQADMTSYRELAEKGLAALADSSDSRRHRLEQMRELFAFAETEFPELLTRFRVEHRR